MEFEEIMFLFKDPASGGGGSPAFYRVSGGYLAQGIKVGPATHDRVREMGATSLPDHEDLVFIPDRVADQFRGTA